MGSYGSVPKKKKKKKKKKMTEVEKEKTEIAQRVWYDTILKTPPPEFPPFTDVGVAPYGSKKEENKAVGECNRVAEGTE